MTDLEREEFRQFNGRTILDLCALGEKIIDLYAADIRKTLACDDRACPLVGSHNTDECAELIADARAEGQRI